MVEERSCGWLAKMDPAGFNVLFPDEAAHYWVLQAALLPGDTLRLLGEYPHSRYFSFTTYDPALRSADGIRDIDIRPAKGSTNPFRAGADREAERRSYAVDVVVGDRPTAPKPNTVYTGSQDGSRTSPIVTLIYRNYRQDAGYGDDGGVGLPDVAVRTAAGDTVIPDCQAPTIPETGLNDSIADAEPLVPFALVGAPEPIWRKFYNLPTSAAYFATTPTTGSVVGDTLSPLTTSTASGGFADNPDNKYLTTVVSSGAGEVAVIRGAMPTFADTYRGARRMPAGQVRYWSLCSEEFASGRFYGCLVDDQVPLRAARTFTIVVSPPGLRPSNAYRRCGIAWLPTGPAPDTVLLLRNMLAAPDFTRSIQAARYGHERDDLGRYYPTTTYRTRSQVEAWGCSR